MLGRHCSLQRHFLVDLATCYGLVGNMSRSFAVSLTSP